MAAHNRFYKLNHRFRQRRGGNPKYSWLASTVGTRMEHGVVTLYDRWFRRTSYA